MPQFFLHIHNTQGSADDEEGLEAKSLLQARELAIAGIRSLLSAEIANGAMDLAGRIDITDATGEVLMTVPFAEAVTISRP